MVCRDATYGSRDLLVFNTALDLDFHRQPGQKEVSQVHSEVAITPARWLSLNVYESFTPQNFTLNQVSTGLTLRDGLKRRVKCGTRHRLDVLSQQLHCRRFAERASLTLKRHPHVLEILSAHIR